MKIIDTLKTIAINLGGNPTGLTTKSAVLNEISKHVSGGGGGGDGAFVVTFTKTGSTTTANKTFNEVVTAITAGKNVVGLYINDSFTYYLPVIEKRGDTTLYFYSPRTSASSSVMSIYALEIQMSSNGGCYVYTKNETVANAVLKVVVEYDDTEYTADYSYTEIKNELDNDKLVYMSFGDIPSYYMLTTNDPDSGLVFVNPSDDDTFTLSTNNKWSRAM